MQKIQNRIDSEWCSHRNVEVSVSDFETPVPGSTFTKALRFRQEGHPELKCYSAPVKS